MEIGKQIKYYRLRKGVRQEDLAEYMGVSAQAVSKWETESSLPDIALLPRLSVYLGVTIDDLFRIPQEDQLTRIENALVNTVQLDEPAFQSYKSFLEGLLEDKERKARAHTLLSALHNHRAYSDHQAAIEHAKAAIHLEPDEKEPWVYLIEGYEAYCGDEWWDNHFELIDYCQEFLKDHPGHFQCLYSLIENMLGDKRYQEALPYIEELEKVPGRGPYQAMLYRGDVAQGMGEMKKALELWNRSVEENPNQWYGYCDRADRLKKLGRYEEALADYEKSFAIQAPPRLSDGLYSRAQLFEQLGRYDEAIHEHERLIEVLRSDFHCPEEGGVNGISDHKKEIERLKKRKKEEA